MAEVLDLVDNVISEPIIEYKRNFRLSNLRYADPRQVLTEIELYNGIKVLDIGSGSGKLLFTIHELLNNVELVGIDTDRSKVEAAQARVNDDENIEFKFADAGKLPCKSDYFDIITCTNTFFYIEHKGKTLQEVFRVLKKYGRFVMLESIQGTDYKNKLDKIMRQSPFIKFSRRFLDRTALFSRSYLITCQK